MIAAILGLRDRVLEQQSDPVLRKTLGAAEKLPTCQPPNFISHKQEMPLFGVSPGLAIDNIQVKSSPLPVFINKVL